MGLREDKSSLVGLIFLLGLPLKTEILTPEIITCKLLVLKRPTQFFLIQVCLRDIFLNHLAPPSKGELIPKASLFN